MPSNGSTPRTPAANGSAAQTAYIQLKNLIVNLDLPPGSVLREADLQEQVGVGRTPLRDAFQRLAHEGMLRIYPRRAIVVAKLGLSEVRQIYEVRLVLEPAAASLAAEHISSAEAGALRKLEVDLRAAAERSDVRAFLEADQVFHRAVAEYAQNPLLFDYVDHVQTLNLWLWNMYFSSQSARSGDLFAHEAIVAALAAADGRAAAAAMHEHVVRSKKQLLIGLSRAERAGPASSLRLSS